MQSLDSGVTTRRMLFSVFDKANRTTNDHFSNDLHNTKIEPKNQIRLNVASKLRMASTMNSSIAQLGLLMLLSEKKQKGF